jgi:signal transduction histidine kinase
LLGRLRSSFATKLLAAGLILSLLVIGGISGYLLVSRDQQTRAGALSNSDNRAAVMKEVLESFTGEQSLSAAQSLAKQPALVSALQSDTPAASVAQRFAGSATTDLSQEILLIADATGTPIYARPAPDVAGVGVPASAVQDVLRDALTGSVCAFNNQPGACGLDVLAMSQPAYTVAVPVIVGTRAIGAVAYVAPLQFQLSRFSTLFQFPTAFIPAYDSLTELREQNDSFVLSAAPAGVQSGIRARSNLVHAIYDAPTTSGPPASVAGSFEPVTGPDGRTIVGYVGVEVPLSAFVGDARTDELTLGVITVFVLLITALAVFLFVESFVRRPIRRLERGVARIAGGDYTTSVEVRSKDELGRLATSVNQMRDSISMYVTEIESARARLDSAVQRVSGVSRALTTTTGGVDALQREVVRTAAEISGEGSIAVLAVREEDQLVVRATYPEQTDGADLQAWGAAEPLLDGTVVRQKQRRRSLLAVPMFYQDNVVGALAIIKPVGAPAAADDEQRVLAVLGNNTAIAMENARLFEQERETVRRLRELDAMKTDFLSTVQHELRTPLTAILGLSDLMEMCWEMWDDSPKLEAVRDIQVAAKNLYDIVETIIDFSAVDGETIGLNPSTVSVEEAVHKAVEAVGERYKGGLPIPVDVDADVSLSVFADPERFEQVLRALIDNAVKFSDGRGRVIVRARTGSSRSEVNISVSDKGIGISDDDLPRIFDRFYQVDNTATRRYGGTGMGLALVKRLVQAHGAKVSVKTALGQGTKVTLVWPAAAAASSGEARVVAEARGDAPPRRKPDPDRRAKEAQPVAEAAQPDSAPEEGLPETEITAEAVTAHAVRADPG